MEAFPEISVLFVLVSRSSRFLVVWKVHISIPRKIDLFSVNCGQCCSIRRWKFPKMLEWKAPCQIFVLKSMNRANHSDTMISKYFEHDS